MNEPQLVNRGVSDSGFAWNQTTFGGAKTTPVMLTNMNEPLFIDMGGGGPPRVV